MWLNRSLGIQLHPTSLPGGRLGPEAYRFVDWLAAAGAQWWQVLPLNPPDVHGSPYSSESAFAGWVGVLAEPDAPVAPAESESFRARHRPWLEDWIAFAGPDALADQVRFDREWHALRAYAADHGVRIIGDIPIYVAKDSCDHSAHPELFLPVDDVLAGAPPDPLNDGGQLWDLPLYDWDAMQGDGYRWWIERTRRTLGLVDVARIDHFRGFVDFWTVRAGSEDARDGWWSPGPGRALFDAAAVALGSLPMIAEDLGVITPEVEQLRDDLALPGMAVMLWAFDGSDDNPHRLENHRVRQVVYTSTHDTDTLAGHLGRTDVWDVVELALGSKASLAILPAQDVLELGSEARMNRPGVLGGNWEWRLQPGQLGVEHAARVRRAAEASGRV